MDRNIFGKFSGKNLLFIVNCFKHYIKGSFIGYYFCSMNCRWCLLQIIARQTNLWSNVCKLSRCCVGLFSDSIVQCLKNFDRNLIAAFYRMTTIHFWPSISFHNFPGLMASDRNLEIIFSGIKYVRDTLYSLRKKQPKNWRSTIPDAIEYKLFQIKS